MASSTEAISLAVEHVSVTYPNGHQAIRDVTFTLQGRTVCALVGVNGSGKSTLFNTIMGIIRPQSGSVRVNGLPVAQAMRQFSSPARSPSKAALSFWMNRLPASMRKRNSR